MNAFRRLISLVENLFDRTDLFEMANLPPHRTGLPFVVFVSQRGGARHDVRVKVSKNAKAMPREMVSVAIRPNVRVIAGAMSSHDLSLLTRWIELNRDALVAYWQGDIEYTEDLFRVIVPLVEG